MRCADCSKFVGLDFDEPTCEAIDIDQEGNISAEIHLVRNCAECGSELKTGDLTAEACIAEEDAIKPHLGKEGETAHQLTIEEVGTDPIEEGGGRYAKSYFGGEVTFRVYCACCENHVFEGTVSDKMAASEMEENS